MLPGSITVAHSLEWLFERLCCLLLFVVVAGCCFCFWCCGCSQAPFLLCSEAPGEQVVSSQEDSLSAPERLPLFTVHSVVMPLWVWLSLHCNSSACCSDCFSLLKFGRFSWPRPTCVIDVPFFKRCEPLISRVITVFLCLANYRRLSSVSVQVKNCSRNWCGISVLGSPHNGTETV